MTEGKRRYAAMVGSVEEFNEVTQAFFNGGKQALLDMAEFFDEMPRTSVDSKQVARVLRESAKGMKLTVETEEDNDG